jgi:hypothetical protein
MRLVGMAVSIQALITLGSANSPKLSEQPEQSLSSPSKVGDTYYVTDVATILADYQHKTAD